MIENRNASIQGLRGLAVLLVVLFHANGLIPGGFLGVDVFFVISGFVITGMVHREWKATGDFDPIAFLTRRAKRLLPSLFLLLLLVLVYSMFFESWILEQPRTQLTLFFALFSFSNWRFAFEQQNYFSLSNDSNPLLHTWSLGVEEQFYYLFPAVVILLNSYMRSRYFQKYVVFSVAITVFSVSLYLQIHFSLISADRLSQLLPLRQFIHNILHPFYGTVGRVWEFTLGIFGYFIARKEFKLPSVVRILLCLTGVFVIVLTAFIAGDSVPAWSWANIFVCSSTAVVLIATDQQKSGQILGFRPMVWIGDRSYGWYLWHWPLIVGIQRNFGVSIQNSVTASIVGLLISSVTFSSFENPIRVKIWTAKKTFLLLSAPFFLLLGSVGFANYVVTPNFIQATATTYSEVVNGCRPNFNLCVFPSNGKNKYILLVGDSHGLSIATPMLRISDESGLGLIICTKQCQDTNTIIDLAKMYDLETLVSMSQFQSAAGISSTSAIQFGRDNPSIRVILILDNPLFDDWNSPTILGPKTQSMLHRDVVSQQLQARNFLIDATRGHANISTLDTLEHICSDSICPVRDGKKYLYFDDNHLTEFGALKLYPALKNAVVSRG